MRSNLCVLTFSSEMERVHNLDDAFLVREKQTAKQCVMGGGHFVNKTVKTEFLHMQRYLLIRGGGGGIDCSTGDAVAWIKTQIRSLVH